MAIIKAQKVPQKIMSAEDTLCLFCYYYPAYKYEEAKQLPGKRVRKLLNTAIKQEAKRMYNLTQIVSSPNTKNGKGVKKLLKHFQKIMED